MKIFYMVATVLAIAAIGSTQSDSEWAELIKEPKFSLSEAIDKGLKEAGEGKVIQAELELDKGKLVYSIDVAQGDKKRNVVLDVKEGKVVENVLEDEDHSKVVGACKITLKKAIENALKKVSGTPIEAELVLSGGKPVIVVKIFDDQVNRIRIDGTNGVETSGDSGRQESKEFTDSFYIEDGELVSKGTNPFFILEPGYTLVLEGKEGSKLVQLKITVLNETKMIQGVETRVVEERETVDGELVEVSRNFFAISKRTNCVYYFGEDVDIYKNGKVVGHEGAWISGKNDARFGLMMPGTPTVGSRFYNEIAPKVAMDRVEIVSLNATVKTPAGEFKNALKIEETNPLEGNEKEFKWFVRGIGLVQDGNLKLVKHFKGKD